MNVISDHMGNHVIIDIFDEEDYDVNIDKNNNDTFGSEVKVISGLSFASYSFENLLKNFCVEEIQSIFIFAKHFNISVEQAIKYKLLCHGCGKKLPIFGTTFCKFECCNKNTPTCAFQKSCVLCHGKESMLMMKKSAIEEAVREADKFMNDQFIIQFL